MMQPMLLLPDVEFVLVPRLHYLAQVLLLLLQLQPQQFLPALVVFLEVAEGLLALGPEVHGNALIEIGLGHLIESLLESIKRLLKSNPLQSFHLLPGINLHLLEVLVVVKTLDQMLVHHNYKSPPPSCNCIVYSSIESMDNSPKKRQRMENFDAVESPVKEKETVERLLEKRPTVMMHPKEQKQPHRELWQDNDGGITNQKYCYPSFLSRLGLCCIPCKVCCPFLFCPCCPCKANPLFQQPMQNLGLLQEWGHFERVLAPGLHVINPISQSVIEVNQQTKMIEYSQIGISRDNVQFDLSVVVFYRVVDSLKLAYRLGNLDIVNCLTQISTGTLRSVLGENPLQEIIENRSLITHRFTEQLNKQVSFWGLHVEICSLKEIRIDPEVQRSLEAVAKTKREVEAMLIDFRAEIECGKLIKEISQIINNEASFQIRYLNMVEGIISSSRQENLIFLSMAMKEK